MARASDSLGLWTKAAWEEVEEKLNIALKISSAPSVAKSMYSKPRHRMKPCQYTFRPITGNDLPFLTQSLISAARASGEAISLENLHDYPDTHRYVLDFPQPRETGVIAELEGRAVGAAWFRLFSHLQQENGGLAPEVIVGVSEEHREKGVGGTLMSELYTAAKQEGWKTLSLGVHQRNTPARRLYEKHGWKRVKSHGEYLLMAKDL